MMIDSLYLDRIEKVIGLLERSCYQALIITGADPHGCEYPAPFFTDCKWLIGFPGSFGSLLFYKEKQGFSVGLWTDSRYHLEALQLYERTPVKVFPLGEKGVLDVVPFLATQKESVKKVYVEGSTVSEATFVAWQRQLIAKGIELVASEGLLAPLNDEKEPALFFPPTLLPLSIRKLYAFSSDFNSSIEERFFLLREKMKEEQVDALWFSKLEEIAWLLDLRGKDVAYNAFFYSYLMLCPKGAILYLKNRAVDSQTLSYLTENHVFIADYPQSFGTFELFPPEIAFNLLGLQPGSLSLAYQKGDCCKALRSRFETLSIELFALPTLFAYVEEFKALRTPLQLAYLEQCMIIDGIALVRLHRWIQQELEKKGFVKERAIVDANELFRQAATVEVLGEAHYLGASFSTIAAAGKNGALVHYHSELGDGFLQWNDSFLLDTGGLFLGATTDMTRVFYFPESEESTSFGAERGALQRYAKLKRGYTLVLKGNLALSRQRFPSGTSGSALDSFARQFLWQAEWDYGHSTGHGVGSGLNVHEGPHGISKRSQVPLKESMVLSNEPGLYLQSEFGIRIENMMRVLPPSNADFLSFETLTLFPYEKELIDLSLLTSEEIQQIHRYHQKVQKKLLPYLTSEEGLWLKKRCHLA